MHFFFDWLWFNGVNNDHDFWFRFWGRITSWIKSNEAKLLNCHTCFK